uniref:Chemokine (C-X-C motif) ligand 8a n=2 Tax=Takifugu rubripes TaxID=31033 RepID=H2SW91_TAKRU
MTHFRDGYKSLTLQHLIQTAVLSQGRRSRKTKESKGHLLAGFGFIRKLSEEKPSASFIVHSSVMCSRVFLTSLVVLLAFLAISNGMSLRSLGVEQHCRCIQTESRPIGRHIGKVELIPPNSHCEETEIIATLKMSGQEVCLDPKAPWVKKVINKIMSSRQR